MTVAQVHSRIIGQADWDTVSGHSRLTSTVNSPAQSAGEPCTNVKPTGREARTRRGGSREAEEGGGGGG